MSARVVRIVGSEQIVRRAGAVGPLVMALLAMVTDVRAQRTWVVDVLGGPGSQFTKIQPAIDAAAPGDVILIRPGASSFYDGFVLTKGLTVMADQRGAVRVLPDIIVRGVPAAERAILRGLVGYLSTAILLERNAGTVMLEKCQHGFHGGRLVIRDSANVALNQVVSIDTRIESSFVTMNRGLSDSSVAQDPLLWVASSVVVFGNTVMRGARANYSMSTCKVLLPPGEAIAGYDSLLILGAGTSIIGGRLNVSGGSCPPISLEANAMRGSNVRVIRDPAATLGVVDGTVMLQTKPQPTLDGIVADEVAGRMDFDLLASPGSAAAMIASLPTDPAYTSLGIQWIHLGAYVVGDTAVVDPTGHRKVSFVMPRSYPIGHPMVFQSAVLDQGTPVWSTPSVIVKN